MTTERLGRIVTVTIDRLEVSGLDCEFVAEKTLEPDPNTCTLSVFNLSRAHRAQLEEIRPKKGDARGIPVRIEAGYETTGTSLIWLGDLRTVDSTTDGVSVRTTVASGDGEKAFQHAEVSKAFGPGTAPDVALRAIARAMGIGDGNLDQAIARLTAEGRASIAASLKHGVVFAGPAARQLTDWGASAGLTWSIQDGSLQLLNRGKALAQKAILLDSVTGVNTGLLDSPTVDNEGTLTARMLMTPDVYPGRLVALKSQHIDGTFRIERASYVGDNFGGEFSITIEASRY